MQDRGEEVTSHEDELRTLSEELEVGQRELALRAQELEGRMEVLRQREQETEGRIKALRKLQQEAEERMEALRQREVALEERGTVRDPSSSAAGVITQVSDDEVQEVEEVDDEDDVEELDEIEPLGTNPRADLSDAVELLEESGSEEPEPTMEEIVGNDEVQEVDEIDGIEEVTGVGPVRRPEDPGIGDVKTTIQEVPSVPPEAPGSLPPMPMTPPEAFLDDPAIQMAASLGEGPWLFARLDEGREDAFRGEGVELLVQLVVVEGRPVVLLSLVDGGEGRPYVRRAGLDPDRPSHRTILEELRRKYEATVALFGPDGRFERTLKVGGPRQGNVQRVLERLREAGDYRVDATTAVERALAAAPPYGTRAIPSATGSGRPATRPRP